MNKKTAWLVFVILLTIMVFSPIASSLYSRFISGARCFNGGWCTKGCYANPGCTSHFGFPYLYYYKGMGEYGDVAFYSGGNLLKDGLVWLVTIVISYTALFKLVKG